MVDDERNGIVAELRGLRQDLLRLGQVALADRDTRLPAHLPPTRLGEVRALHARCVSDRAAALQDVILLSHAAVLERFGKPTRAEGQQSWTYQIDQIAGSGRQSNFVLYFKDGVVTRLNTDWGR